MQLSISSRLTLWYGLSMLILLGLFVIFLYASFHIGLHRDFEEQLHYEQSVLEPAIETSSGTPVLVPSERMRSVAYQTDGTYGTYVRLLLPSGKVLYQSPNFNGHTGFPQRIPTTNREGDISHMWLDAPVRTLYSSLQDEHDDLVGWLEITRLESPVHRELHRLGWLLALGVLIGAVVAIGSGHQLARRALQPVADLTTAANQIQAHDLDARLPAGFGIRDELTNLANTFNAMLGRLQASFERERRFRADAAHEMFTPLSALQSEVEVSLRRKREVDYYEETLGRILDHTRRLSGTVDGLLQLSRAEASGQHDPVATDIIALIRELLAHYIPLAKGRNIDLVLRGDNGLLVLMAPGQLKTVLDNLLDNAIKYTPMGGELSVTVENREKFVAVIVEDSGIGFDVSEGEHLFDRFYRANRPEVQRERGGGLGLSIAKAIVDSYGGHLETHSEGIGRGSKFVVQLRRCIATSANLASNPVPPQ